MAGYWNDPAATAEAMRGGWLHTGDVGSFDEDGYLTLRDRSKDVIISGGANIYPREVEEVLLRHPGVRPRRYLLLAELPKNNYGKVLKRELRAGLSA